jgi:hypothetical protein
VGLRVDEWQGHAGDGIADGANTLKAGTEGPRDQGTEGTGIGNNAVD